MDKFKLGFIKRALEYGYNFAQAENIFKNAGFTDELSHLGAVASLQKYMNSGDAASSIMSSGAHGALTGGLGALAGGGLGYGLGSLGNSDDPQKKHRNQTIGALLGGGLGGAVGGFNAGASGNGSGLADFVESLK